MKWWNDLIVDNPMLIEVRLFRRKFFGAHAVANTLALAAIAFLVALVIGLLYMYEIPYVPVAITALLVVSILVPVLLHAAIAGERERRSWDMLLVAPITNAQIVVGKFLGAASAVGMIVATFGVALFISSFPDGDRINTGSMVFFVMLTYAFALAGFSIFVSSLAKRSMTALSIIYGSLFFVMVVLPSLLTASSPHSTDAAFYLNPFHVVTEINAPENPNVVDPLISLERNSYMTYGGVHVILYSILAIAFLSVAIYQLNSSGLDDPMLNKAK